MFSKTDGRKIRKSFGSLAAAKAWRNDAATAVRNKTLRAPTATTIDQAATAWVEGAKAGLIRTRGGDPYKPSAIRTYEAALRLRVCPVIGNRRVSEITRADLQELADGLLAEGLAPSTIGVLLLPVRAIFRRAFSRGEIAVNPTTGLELPRVRGGRDRITPPEQCARLLDALPQRDRALWACAMFGGLRRGELMALRIEDIDLAAGVIHVRRGWDPIEGEITTKSGKERRVPIAVVLRDYLDEHLLGLGWREGFVFGLTSADPYTVTALTVRATKAWRAAKLERVTLHECRHTFASMLIHAGVNPKAIQEFMGHSTIEMTFDRYGHLMPGSRDQAWERVDADLTKACGTTAGQRGTGQSGLERVTAGIESA